MSPDKRFLEMSSHQLKDCEIYLNWQAQNCNWYWYAGQSGTGLP